MIDYGKWYSLIDALDKTVVFTICKDPNASDLSFCILIYLQNDKISLTDINNRAILSMGEADKGTINKAIQLILQQKKQYEIIESVFK